MPPPRPARRIRPALFWLVIGCVAGASFASFGGIGQSISELRGRATALVPFPGAPPPDVPAGVAPSLAPLAEARIAPAALAPLLLPEATSEEEEATPVALAGPPKPAAVPANLHVEFGGTDVRPTVSSTPVAPGAPPPAPPRNAAFEVNHGREDPALPHVPPVLAVPSAPAVVARGGATALSFRPWTSRIVVQAPQNMPPDRREAALSRLTESDWSAEEAASSPFTVSETHVRYYHAQDRRAAEDLAGLFDASARDFTSYTPSPDEGLLELWLSGKGAPPVIRQARSRSTSPRAAANSATPTRSSPRATNLFDRMANALEGTSGGSPRGTWREGSDDGSSGSARGESGSRSPSASSDDGRSSVGNGSRGDDGRAGDRSGAGGAGGSSSGGGGGSSSGSGGSSSSGGASSSNGGESSSGGGSPSAGSGGTSGAGNGNASGGRGGTGGGNGGERGNSGDHGRGADNAGGNGKGGGNNGRGGGNGGGKGGNNGRGNGR